jgi:Uma2 family endonuclease
MVKSKKRGKHFFYRSKPNTNSYFFCRMKTDDTLISAPEIETAFAEEDAVIEDYKIIVLRKEGGYTLKEYFALEDDSVIRHEFHNGELYQMPGAKPNHELIVATLTAMLFYAVRKHGGYLFTSNLKVELPDSKRFLYPDISIVGGTPEYGGKKKTTLLNPTVLIEVLSDSTAHYDMGEKFAFYRALPSLREYLLFDQDTAWVLHYRLNERGRWEIIEHDGKTLVLESVDCTLAIRDVYAHLA